MGEKSAETLAEKFRPSTVCIPPLLAALSSYGRFFLLHFVRAFTVVCFYFTLPGLRPYDSSALELELKAEIARFVRDPCLLKAAKKPILGHH